MVRTEDKIVPISLSSFSSFSKIRYRSILFFRCNATNSFCRFATLIFLKRTFVLPQISNAKCKNQVLSHFIKQTIFSIHFFFDTYFIREQWEFTKKFVSCIKVRANQDGYYQFFNKEKLIPQIEVVPKIFILLVLTFRHFVIPLHLH